MCGIFNSQHFACWIILHSMFQKIYFRVSNSLDRDQARRGVGPDLGPSSLQKFPVNDTKPRDNFLADIFQAVNVYSTSIGTMLFTPSYE